MGSMTLTFKDAMLLYKNSILPYIDLGSIFYGSANKGVIKGLETAQSNCSWVVHHGQCDRMAVTL